MSQNFPNITGEDYIDSGILALQDRDNAVLTWFGGTATPNNPFNNLIWNDLSTNSIKWYHNSDWETIIDYGQDYITSSNLSVSYQALNSNLTDYSEVSVSGTGFITNEWIPISSFFINKLWSGFKDNIEIGNLAYKSKLGTQEIEDGSISIDKLTTTVDTVAPFKVGDVIPSFNPGNKSGCVKMSKSADVVFTIGATASNSTYTGNTYKNLFRFVWQNQSLPIYNSNGVSTTKGSNWEADWNNNKRLQLPCYDVPNNDEPSERKISSGVGTFTVSKSGYYEVILVGGGGGGAGNSAGTWGHQSLCCGAAGAGFRGTILLNKNDTVTYNVGAGGSKGNSQTDWGQGKSRGGDGGTSTFVVNGTNYLTCGGGQAGECNSYKGNRGNGWIRPLPAGGAVTVHVGNVFTNVTSVNGGDGQGTSTGNVIQTNGPFGNDWGKGGSAQGFGNNAPSKLGDGGSGYFDFKFLSPKEYGTTNSTVVTELDKLYNSITYFMKY